MARSIRVPFLVDVTFVDDARSIDALESDARVDRNYGERGPWYNRLLQKQACVRTARGHRSAAGVPSARRRGAGRAPSRLWPRAWDRSPWTRWRMIRMWWISPAGSARDEDDDPESVGPMVQQFAGRLFDPDYTGDATSYKAAKTVDRYLRANPLCGAWLSYTGRVSSGSSRAVVAGRRRHPRGSRHRDRVSQHGGGGGAHADHCANPGPRRPRHRGDHRPTMPGPTRTRR